MPKEPASELDQTVSDIVKAATELVTDKRVISAAIGGLIGNATGGRNKELLALVGALAGYYLATRKEGTNA